MKWPDVLSQSQNHPEPGLGGQTPPLKSRVPRPPSERFHPKPRLSYTWKPRDSQNWKSSLLIGFDFSGSGIRRNSVGMLHHPPLAVSFSTPEVATTGLLKEYTHKKLKIDMKDYHDPPKKCRDRLLWR